MKKNQEEQQQLLADIQRAIEEFPNVLRQQKLAFESKERVLKRFMPMAAKLQELVESQKSAALDPPDPSTKKNRRRRTSE